MYNVTIYKVGIEVLQGQGPIGQEILIVAPKDISKRKLREKVYNQLSKEGSVKLTSAFKDIGTGLLIL